MQCPFCGGDSQVSDSRATSDGQVRRRRACNDCRRKFTTYERVGAPSLRVAKRSGKIEPFSSEKLLRCLTRVGRGRLDRDAAISLARSIEARLIDANQKKVPSALIVELVLARLGELDTVSRDRLAVNYLDEDGQLRTRGRAEDEESTEQLRLFGESTSTS